MRKAIGLGLAILFPLGFVLWPEKSLRSGTDELGSVLGGQGADPEGASGQVGTSTTKAPRNASEQQNFAPRSVMPEETINERQQRAAEHMLTAPIPEQPAAALDFAAPRETRPAATELAPLDIPAPIQLIDSLTVDAATNLCQTICEPSVAARRGNKDIMVTGNVFAAHSSNGGQNFTYLNPATTFPNVSSQIIFCCDQVLQYDPQNDLMLWLLQYRNDAAGNNIFRLAIAKGDEITSETWRYYDFSPQSVGGWTGEMFDFPDLALSNNFLYITSNTYSQNPDPTRDPIFKRSVVLRLPLKQLADKQALSFTYYSDAGFSPRLSQGATDTMYWAVHVPYTQLRVYSWPEPVPGDPNSLNKQPTVNTVTVQPWTNVLVRRIAKDRKGLNWLVREDYRITSAWVAKDKLGFAWSSAQGGPFKFPHMRAVILDRSSKQRLAEPHLWNTNFAYAYLSAAPNTDGEVGVVVQFGGGIPQQNPPYPSLAVGKLVAAQNGSWAWNLRTAVEGQFGPVDGKWGDYLSIRPHGDDSKTWVAAGFTLQTSSDRSGVLVRYLRFK